MPVNHTHQSSIQDWLLRAIVRVAAYLNAVGGDDVIGHYGFLVPYLDTARKQFPEITSLVELDKAWQTAAKRWHVELAASPAYPINRLRSAGLADEHLSLLFLAALVEIDARFGTVYSVLHPFPDELRPTIGLLDDLIRFNRPGTLNSSWKFIRDLEQRGLVEIHHQEKPRAAQTVGLTAPVWDALSGEAVSSPHPSLVHRSREEWATLEELRGLLPGDLLGRLARVPLLVDRRLAQGVVVRGMRGSGRLRALGAVARSLDLDLLIIRRPEKKLLPQLCRLAGALAVLQNAMPIIDLELAPGETVKLPALAGYQGIMGVILGREGNVSGPQADGCVTLHAPAPGYTARKQQWSQVLEPGVNGTQTVIDQASRSYHLTLGAVERAGPLSRAYAALNQHAHVEISDVQEACRTLNQQSLENLATQIHTKGTWEDLVISDNTQAELANLLVRCRHRETVLANLGRGFAGATRGVRALFSGASGTGKTLAARIISTQLGLDLYRVDLSSVVSKYIGETERNLSRLFARAEELDIILLLDEGDSLLTTRTDVRNSNDRYANMETNYLLQRLEQYEGIILITTNTINRVDSAFQRRMDVLIEFAIPDARQRQSLWYLHMPEQHTVSEHFIRQVSLRCQLTGGQIRNAALHATVQAVEAGSPVDETFLAEGVHREYTKIGAASPLR